MTARTGIETGTTTGVTETGMTTGGEMAGMTGETTVATATGVIETRMEGIVRGAMGDVARLRAGGMTGTVSVQTGIGGLEVGMEHPARTGAEVEVVTGWEEAVEEGEVEGAGATAHTARLHLLEQLHSSSELSSLLCGTSPLHSLRAFPLSRRR